MRRVIETPNPNGYLLERILSRENMRQAWKRVKANKGASGVDKISIEDFPDFARENWKTIRESLSDGSYQPLPVKRVEIPKQSGGTRPLGIPTVTDRLIQQAISQVLMPIFDPEFSDSGREGLPMMRSIKSVNTSKRATGLRWTWICQSFSIRSTMMRLCTGWPGKSKINVS
jgi:hypothetical protein